MQNVEMRGWALLPSVSVKLAELRRALGLGEEWIFTEGLYDDVPNVEMRRVALRMFRLLRQPRR